VPAPNIFEFTDFREYLKSRYQWEKSRDRKYSHRFIVEKVGASSTGWFSDLVNGRISLTGSFLAKLLALLGLHGNEEEFFRGLVAFAQAGSFEEKNRWLEKILAFKELKADLVGQERFEYYGKWYYAAIRELLFFHDFRGDYAALGKKLDPPITPMQARKAIRLLEKLEFIEKEADGKYRPKAAVVRKDSQFKSFHLVRFLKSNLELAAMALDRVDKEQRDISALTLALSAENFGKARAEIKALRKRLLAMSETNHPDDKVYQCNFQIFPLTR
jgi:uncharacterized protein (TIGR02147 family)